MSVPGVGGSSGVSTAYSDSQSPSTLAAAAAILNIVMQVLQGILPSDTSLNQQTFHYDINIYTTDSWGNATLRPVSTILQELNAMMTELQNNPTTSVNLLPQIFEFLCNIGSNATLAQNTQIQSLLNSTVGTNWPGSGSTMSFASHILTLLMLQEWGHAKANSSSSSDSTMSAMQNLIAQIQTQFNSLGLTSSNALVGSMVDTLNTFSTNYSNNVDLFLQDLPFVQGEGTPPSWSYGDHVVNGYENIVYTNGSGAIQPTITNTGATGAANWDTFLGQFMANNFSKASSQQFFNLDAMIQSMNRYLSGSWSNVVWPLDGNAADPEFNYNVNIYDTSGKLLPVSAILQELDSMISTLQNNPSTSLKLLPQILEFLSNIGSNATLCQNTQLQQLLNTVTGGNWIGGGSSQSFASNILNLIMLQAWGNAKATSGATGDESQVMSQMQTFIAQLKNQFQALGLTSSNSLVGSMISNFNNNYVGTYGTTPNQGYDLFGAQPPFIQGTGPTPPQWTYGYNLVNGNGLLVYTNGSGTTVPVTGSATGVNEWSTFLSHTMVNMFSGGNTGPSTFNLTSLLQLLYTMSSPVWSNVSMPVDGNPRDPTFNYNVNIYDAKGNLRPLVSVAGDGLLQELSSMFSTLQNNPTLSLNLVPQIFEFICNMSANSTLSSNTDLQTLLSSFTGTSWPSSQSPMTLMQNLLMSLMLHAWGNQEAVGNNPIPAMQTFIAQLQSQFSKLNLTSSNPLVGSMIQTFNDLFVANYLPPSGQPSDYFYDNAPLEPLNHGQNPTHVYPCNYGINGNGTLVITNPTPSISELFLDIETLFDWSQAMNSFLATNFWTPTTAPNLSFNFQTQAASLTALIANIGSSVDWSFVSWPDDGDSDDPSFNSISTSIYKADGTTLAPLISAFGGDGTLQNLYKMMYSMSQYSANSGMLWPKMIELIANIGSDETLRNNSAVQALFATPIPLGDSTLGTVLVQQVVSQAWGNVLANGGTLTDANAAANNLMSLFLNRLTSLGITTSNKVAGDMVSALNTMMAPAGAYNTYLTSLINNHYNATNPPRLSYSVLNTSNALYQTVFCDNGPGGHGTLGWMQYLNGVMGNSISASPTSSSQPDFGTITSGFYSSLFNDLYASMSNPALAIAVFFAMLSLTKDDDYQAQLGGLGISTKYLTNFTNSISTLTSNYASSSYFDISKTPSAGANAMAWMQQVQDQYANAFNKASYLGGPGNSFLNAVQGAVDGINGQIDSSTTPPSATLLTLWHQAQTDSTSAGALALAAALNNLSQSKGSAGDNPILDNLNTLSKIATGRSQTVGTMTSGTAQKDNQVVNVMQSAFTSIQDAISAIISNQIPR